MDGQPHAPEIRSSCCQNIKTFPSHVGLLLDGSKVPKNHSSTALNWSCKLRKQIWDKWKIDPDVSNIYELFMNDKKEETASSLSDD